MLPSTKNKVRLLSIASKIIDTPKNITEKLVQADKIENPNEDLLYLEFVLCHEGANENRDGFLLSELQDNVNTVKFKDLNVEHSDRIVGCIYDGVLIEKEADASYAFQGGFRPHIVCSAVVYQFKFPEVAQDLRDKHGMGNLRFSMETWYTSAQCSECDESFEAGTDYCDHLNNRFTQGSAVTRWLRGITFGGAGIVENPADPDASSISVADTEKTRKQLFAEILKEGSHDLFSGDVDFIVSLIGESLKNFEDVFEAWIKSLENNEVVDMSIVSTRVKEIVNQILTDDSSDASLSKGGQLTVAYTFDNKEDLINSPEVQEAIEDTIEKKVTEKLANQDKEGKIAEMQETMKNKDIEVTELQSKVKDMETDKAETLEKAENEKKDREAIKLSETRFEELTEAGVTYNEDRLEKVMDRLKAMSEEDYVEYKEDMVANLPVKTEEEIKAEKKKAETARIVLVPNKSTASGDEFPFMEHLGVALKFNQPAISADELKN